MAAEGKDKDRVSVMAFQTAQVLEMWKRTEPWMTEEKLKETLDFFKIRGLFARFFANIAGGNSHKS